MAKKNQTQAVEVASTAKKVLKVTSTAKKPLKVSSTAKKTSEVASTSKKPMKENVSTAKKKNKQSEPPESSNDDEEEKSDSSSDEEDEPTKDHNKKNQETPPASSESESEAESESGSEPEATKTTPPATVSTSASPNKKRQSEEAASTDVKRAKKCLKSHINGQEAVKSPSTAKKTSESKKPLKQNVSTSKKKNKQSEPPESSTDDKEEESDSSSDEEDEPTKNNKKNQETPPASESESEAESETEAASTKTQPPGTVSTSASPSKKRQSEEAASTDVKRAKKESGTETAKKKGTFERVWTENDEIVLLQGMIDYKNETGESPYENMSGFYQMVKKSISFDVKSGKQFSSKIWALKNKYVGKRKNGVEPSFTKPHDLRCLELANTIWKTDVDSTLVKKIKLEDDSLKIDGVKLQEGWFERSFLVRVIKDLGVMVDEATVKKKWSLVPVETKKRLEEKFMALFVSLSG